MPTVLVTGGGRGIGAAVCSRFAREGYTLVAPTRAELDFRDTAAVDAFANSPAARAADVLVNNVGINRPAALEAIDRTELREHLDVNVVGAVLLVRSVGAAMARRGGGRIVNIGSVYGSVARRGRAMYTATKAALEGLTKSAALEFGNGGVLVNAVCPGFIDTELTRRNNTPHQIEALLANVPLGRLGTVEEVAELVFYLGSARNTYVTGQSIAIDGGFLVQ